MSLTIDNVRALLLDIEGTTTPIAFVHEGLFPYARERMATFIVERWDDPEVQVDVALLRAQSLSDRSQGEDAPAIPTEGSTALQSSAVIAYALWLMDRDRKVTGLKALQGKIWRAGYEDGSLEGELFDEVPEAMRRWREAGRDIYIFSSGSVEAQKLLFAHSIAGDLTPLIAGYYDTTTGAKREATSYEAIARACAQPPEAMLFLTDVLAEARAARDAGMQVAIMDRPGNAPQPEHDLPVLENFDTL